MICWKTRSLRAPTALDALSGNVEFPAVIGAAQSAFLIASKPQRCAAVRAKFIDQAITPIAVAEGDQPLGQQFDPHRRGIVLRQFLRQQRRCPAAAEHLAHQGSRSGLGDEIVLVPSQHPSSPRQSSPKRGPDGPGRSRKTTGRRRGAEPRSRRRMSPVRLGVLRRTALSAALRFEGDQNLRAKFCGVGMPN